MKKFIGFEHGMGIGGWLTNYKRFNVLTPDKYSVLTIGDYEHFESYITEKDVAYIASLGMDHIRLGFDQVVIADQSGKLRGHIVDIMKNFCDTCEKYGVNVVLNLHKAVGNYCDIGEEVTLFDSDALANGFVGLWEQMEDEFSAYPKIAFELLNEVRDVPHGKWNGLAQRTISALRRKNESRVIIIGGTCWNAPHELDKLQVFDDENVVYTFHMYAPFSFTHQQGVLQSGPCFYNRKMPYPCDIERYRDYERTVNNDENALSKYSVMDKEYLYDFMSGAAEFVKANPDKILWCGEFGTIRHADIRWREAWFRDVIAFLKKYGIPYCVWNYLSTPNDGNRFSLTDDDDRHILSDGLAKIIRGDI